MVTELDDLYRQILLEHYRSPRRRGRLDGTTHRAEGANPLCGDEIAVELQVEDGTIADVAFSGQGCSISQASASLMADYVLGKPIEDALGTVETFQQMMLSGEAPPDGALGDIEALAGVAKFPMRVKCASLGWKTLEQALHDGSDGAQTAVTTDERNAPHG